MAGSTNPLSLGTLREGTSLKVLISYAFDWILLIAFGLAGLGIGELTPNKRPFSLNDPNISFPFTEHETVPTWLLMVLIALVPVIVILVVALIFVPGATVPSNTPTALVWKRKLWELHVGWLGLALSVVTAWFFTSGMKNMFGKPRPDLLARCEPDIANAEDYVVGGFAGENPLGLLYSASICQSSNTDELDDGFRSYPSGHASSAAAGLIYLSLFLASKFAVTIPFVVPSATNSNAASRSAFPSRAKSSLSEPLQSGNDWDDESVNSTHAHGKTRNNEHNAKIQSVRRQAAAPPIYLLILTIIPFATSIFIAASRWWDFRHHGFDILFGWLMGLVTSVYSFRYYHLPIQEGAGWAWAPRSKDRAFWAGVGRVGYAGDSAATSSSKHPVHRAATSNDIGYRGAPAPAHNDTRYMTQRQVHGVTNVDDAYYPGAQATNAYGEGPFQDVEMQRMGRI